MAYSIMLVLLDIGSDIDTKLAWMLGWLHGDAKSIEIEEVVLKKT
jgi:hypothetical protein